MEKQQQEERKLILWKEILSIGDPESYEWVEKEMKTSKNY